MGVCVCVAGSCKYPDGGMYNGNWVNGLRDGMGVMVFSNQDRYEGEWRLDRRGLWENWSQIQ